jgi:hypothetical protein
LVCARAAQRFTTASISSSFHRCSST